ncbi:MAG: hypothetical protein IJ512_06330 [Ruminococcus sp.]|nr:hypothetical protein [Ruminococcus sp.]
MNPMAMMRMKSLMEKFRENHPKVPMFFAAASGCVGEGSVIELSIQTAEGKTLCTNMRVTADDLELMETLKEMVPKQ